MPDPLTLAYLLIRTGFGGLVVFGVLIMIAIALATAGGGGPIRSVEYVLCIAGFLMALCLLAAGGALEGVVSGEVFFVLRKGGGLAKLSESPGWYWSCVCTLAILAIGLFASSIALVFRALRPAREAATP